MPWCPQCKAEYQPGVTVCSDCKIALVDDLKDEVLVPFFQAEDKKVAYKLANFFEYSDLNTSVDYDEENGLYILSIPPKKQMEAKKLYQAFYFVERERLEKGESDLLEDETPSEESQDASDPEEISEGAEVGSDLISDNPEADVEEAQNSTNTSEEIYEEEADYSSDTPNDEVTAFDDDEEEDNSTYVMKADQYKDLTGTVWVFLIFGIAGIIFVVLNVLGVVSFFSGLMPNMIMGALFLAFIYIALTTNQRAKKVQAEIDAENKLTEEINEWLKKHVTEEFLQEHRDETISDELNYMRLIDMLKEMLIKEFGSQNLSYLDRLIEEYYNNTFDNIPE